MTLLSSCVERMMAGIVKKSTVGGCTFQALSTVALGVVSSNYRRFMEQIAKGFLGQAAPLIEGRKDARQPIKHPRCL